MCENTLHVHLGVQADVGIECMPECLCQCAHTCLGAWVITHHPLKGRPLLVWHRQGREYLTVLECSWQGSSEPWEQQASPKAMGYLSVGKMSPPAGAPDCMCPLVRWSQTPPRSRGAGLPTNLPQALPLFALNKAWPGAQGKEQETDTAYALLAVLAVSAVY